jgi:hypothetical protein
MLDFTPKKGGGQPRFSLNPADHVRAKAPGGKWRGLHLIFTFGIILTCGIMLYTFLDKLRNSTEPLMEQLKQSERPLAPMAKPSLEGAVPLPLAKELAEQAEAVQAYLKEAKVPLWIDQPDALTIDWAQATLAQDRASPPLPQRASSRDLILRHVKVGSAVQVSGLLEDSRPAPIEGAETGWQRLLVTMEKNQYVELLAPPEAADLVIGREVQAVGRYLGQATLPQAGATTAAPVNLPCIAARVVVQPAPGEAVAATSPYTMNGAWSLPEDLYQNVDDEQLFLETRPYYYTLGQVKIDRTTSEAVENAPNANELANDIHKTPAQFRGKPFKLQGRVFHAWEDKDIAQDKPFGVERVVRIILWTQDYGPVEIDDRGKTITVKKWVLRAFEMAAITDQPIPETGDLISATGRFLRMRAMEVKNRSGNEDGPKLPRQSGRTYTFMFVTNQYALVPPPPEYNWTWLQIGIVVVAIVIGLILMMVVRRESKSEAKVFEVVRRIRQTRQALHRRAGLPPPASAASADQAKSTTDHPAETAAPPTDKKG